MNFYNKSQKQTNWGTGDMSGRD